jgi:hypothetical protein
MNFAPWCLTDDQKPSGARQLHNWSGTERQFCLADPTGANFAQYVSAAFRKLSLKIYNSRIRGSRFASP